MSKLLTRILVIGLITWGVWHLWSNSVERNSIEKNSVEKSLTEKLDNKKAQQAKIDDDSSFEIKKGEKEVREIIKKVAPATTTTSPKQKTSGAISAEKEPIEVDVTNSDMNVVTLETDNITKNTSKFIEGDSSTTVNIYFYEYQIDISSLEIPSGNVIFRAVNNGRLSHNLTLKDGNGNVNFGRIAPKETKLFKINLGTSDYEIFSAIGIDQENNMRANITVQ